MLQAVGTGWAYCFDGFELDTESCELRYGGDLVKAEAMAIRLLTCLVLRAGNLVTKDELVDSVWAGRILADNAISVCVARLRRLLRQHAGASDYITTVYGKGYRFVHPVRRVERSQPGLAPMPAPALSAPCVGREQVIQRLLRLQAATENGSGNVCVLMGEAGVGKTRVVEEVERRVGPRARVAWSFARDSESAPPLSPFRRLLQVLVAEVSQAELERALGDRLREINSWLGRSAASPDEAAATSRAARPTREANFESVLRTLAMVAAKSPLCLVIDDLHRADVASLELLIMLLDEVAHMPVLVLCTARKYAGEVPTEAGARYLSAVLGHRNCVRLTLPRLERHDVSSYVRARLGEERPLLEEAVFVGSEGIPFFMVELMREVEAKGVSDPAELSLDTAALEIFRSRLSRLSDGTQAVLRVAAVIGRAFELSLLQAACGMEAAEMMAGIDEAIEYDILVASSESVSAFAFEHELMRRAIHEGMPHATRRALHLQVADSLESRDLKTDEVVYASAYHRHAALPEGDLSKAVHYCQEAARAAGVVYANSDAVKHLRHALEALELQSEPSPRHRARLYMAKAAYSRGQAGYQEAVDMVRRLGTELKDASLLVHAAFLLNPHPSLKPFPGCRAAYEQALSSLRPAHTLGRAVALSGMACAAPHCFDRAAVQHRLMDARMLAEQSGLDGALYPAWLAELHLWGGELTGGGRARLREQLRALWKKNPCVMPVLPFDLAIDHALELRQNGQTTEADAALSRGERLGRALNHREVLWHVQRMRAWSKIDVGQAGEGLADLQQLHRRAERHEVLGVDFFCAFDRCFMPGDGTTPALDDTDVVALSYDPQDPMHVWAMKIWALAVAGVDYEAREALQTLPAVHLRRLPMDGQALGSLAQIGLAAVRLDQRAYVEGVAELLEPLRGLFAVNIGYRCEGAVTQILAELYAYLGRKQEAVALQRQGMQQCEEAGLQRCLEQGRQALARIT